MFYRLSQYTFYRPVQSDQAIPQGGVLNPRLIRPFVQAEGLPLKSQSHVISSVVALFFSGGPADIARRVGTKRIRKSIQRMLWTGAGSKVLVKILKRLKPTSTNSDTTAAVSLKACAAWIQHPRFHSTPTTIGCIFPRGRRHAMCKSVRAPQLTRQTAAGRFLANFQCGGLRGGRVTTYALTQPKGTGARRVLNPLYYGESGKGLSGQISKIVNSQAAPPVVHSWCGEVCGNSPGNEGSIQMINLNLAASFSIAGGLS